MLFSTLHVIYEIHYAQCLSMETKDACLRYNSNEKKQRTYSTAVWWSSKEVQWLIWMAYVPTNIVSFKDEEFWKESVMQRREECERGGRRGKGQSEDVGERSKHFLWNGKNWEEAIGVRSFFMLICIHHTTDIHYSCIFLFTSTLDLIYSILVCSV